MSTARTWECGLAMAERREPLRTILPTRMMVTVRKGLYTPQEGLSPGRRVCYEHGGAPDLTAASSYSTGHIVADLRSTTRRFRPCYPRILSRLCSRFDLTGLLLATPCWIRRNALGTTFPYWFRHAQWPDTTELDWRSTHTRDLYVTTSFRTNGGAAGHSPATRRFGSCNARIYA